MAHNEDDFRKMRGKAGMSREYRFWVRVDVASKEAAWVVEETLEGLWPFTLTHEENRVRHVFEVSGKGDGSLGGGYMPEQMATDIQRSVWRALQRYVEVFVQSRQIEPDESWSSTELAFAIARDGGLLLQECAECGDPLPFAHPDKRCAACAAAEQEELRTAENGRKMGEEAQDG
jgi:hypothetical protein